MDFLLVDANRFEYPHKTGRVLAVCAVNGADQICVIGHWGHEQAPSEEAGDLWNSQKLFYVGYGKQARFRIRLDIEQEQAQRQAPLFSPLKFEPGGDGFWSNVLHHEDIRTAPEDPGDFFPATLDAGGSIEVERLRTSAVQ